MTTRHWTCPYCNRDCTIHDENNGNIKDFFTKRQLSADLGWMASNTEVIVCPNPDCKNLTIKTAIYEYNAQYQQTGEKIKEWNLAPESSAKPFPDYIPRALLEDYEEACLIQNGSPKASATLSRRCLQGMIRDFWKTKKNQLVDEIEALKDKVDANTWEAIDSVRHVGNIGAHMEKDVNLIIDVDPEEAGLLIWLIETLFEEWYIKRHDREQKMAAIVGVAKAKKELKKAPPGNV